MSGLTGCHQYGILSEFLHNFLNLDDQMILQKNPPLINIDAYVHLVNYETGQDRPEIKI